MEDLSFLQDLAVVMMVAGVVTLLFRFLKQPIILGYIVAGLIIGPHTLPIPLVHNVATIETLAHLGVVFLMFSLGLEFHLRKLLRVGLPAMLTAGVEMLLMLFIGHQAGALFGWTPMEQVFLGCILAVSSTAMIATSLRNAGQIRSDSGQFIVGLLIVEDIAVILMMVLLPGLAGSGELPAREMLLTVLRLGAFLVGLVVVGLIVVPRLLRHVSGHRSDEMLLTTTLGLCFGTALLAARMEYSVALGAFIMGAIVAESREAPRVERLMAPIRDLFMAVFFVAIGMLIQPRYLAGNLVPILVITVLFVAGKVAACAAGAYMGGRDLASSIRIGANMAQLGEFAFVLATLGLQLGVTHEHLYPVIAGVTVLNAVLRPSLVASAEPVAAFLHRRLPGTWVAAMTLFNRRVRHLGSHRRQSPVMKHVWNLAFQIGLNLTLIAAGFITGAMIAGRFPRLTAWVPGHLGRTQTLHWLLIAALLLPLFVATVRKMRALAMLLSDIATDGAGGAHAGLGHLVTSTIFMAQLAVLGLTTMLVSAPLLPSWQSFGILLLITVGLAGIFGRMLNRSYTRAKVALMETWYEPVPRPGASAADGNGDALLTRLITDHEGATGCRLDELDALHASGVVVVAIRRGGVTLSHPDPAESLQPGDGLWLAGTETQLASAEQACRRSAGSASHG